MSGYTPGPWVEDEYKGGWIEGVVEYAGCGSHEAEWTSEANKRLAFAAPELLEALRPFARYLEVLQEMGGNTPKTGPYMAVSSSIAGDAEITVEDMISARAAIRKATEAAS